MIPNDRFFYPHHTPMIDTFYLHTSRFTTFDFQRRTCYKVILFPLIVRTLKLKKGLFFEFNVPAIRKDEFSIL